MPVVYRNDTNQNAWGGSELLGFGLETHLSRKYLDKFQITVSRVRDLDPRYKQVLWLHDLPGDPEADKVFNDPEMMAKFDLFVFVSETQMEAYKRYYHNLYHGKCVHIPNGVTTTTSYNTIGLGKKIKTGPIRVIYHTTPHRGLDILYHGIKLLKHTVEDLPEFHVDVYSSFALYGWDNRDEPFKYLFDQIDNDPLFTRHSVQPNNKMREILSEADIFAYPSTWTETSCLCLIESMADSVVCVHSNLGALPETAAGKTHNMYHWSPDPQEHVNRFAKAFYNTLIDVDTMKSDPVKGAALIKNIKEQETHVFWTHDWDIVIMKWQKELNKLLES